MILPDLSVLIYWMCLFMLSNLPENDGRSLLAIHRNDRDDGAYQYQPAPVPMSDDSVPYPRKPKVLSLSIESVIRARYATTLISSTVENVDEIRPSAQVAFATVLPNTAFISEFVMIVGGKEYEAKVKEKDEAMKEYDSAVISGATAAIVKVNPRESNIFDISVNVGKREKVTFNLTYEELLMRTGGNYKQVINIDPDQLVPLFSVKACVYEAFNITKFTVQRDATFEIPRFVRPVRLDLDDFITYDYMTRSSACVTYAPSEEVQYNVTRSRSGLSEKFQVLYDVERFPDAGEIYELDNFFVHFFSPSELSPLRKHIVFVLDASASMEDHKRMDNMKRVMETVLNDLRQSDSFNIIAFSRGVQVWRPGMRASDNLDLYVEGNSSLECDRRRRKYQATWSNVGEAIRYVQSLEPVEATNIRDALVTGLMYSVLPDYNMHAGALQPLLAFLTDGEATVGVTDYDEILSDVRGVNARYSTPIFSLAFGKEAEIKFLKKLSLQNHGFSRRIYEFSNDVVKQFTEFYKSISTPVLADIDFGYQSDEVDFASLTNSKFPTLFKGDELVVAGKTNKITSKQDRELTVQVKAKAASDILRLVKIRVPKPRPRRRRTTTTSLADTVLFPHKSRAPVFQRKFLERLWAYLTIRQSIDKVNSVSEVTEDFSKRREEALALSLKYGFVTSLTSLIVVKPETPEGSLVDLAEGGEYAVVYASHSYDQSYGGSGADDDDENSTAKPQMLLESITWLANRLAFGNQLQLPLGTLTIAGENQTDIPYEECTGGILYIRGVCRHLRHCVREEIKLEFEVYYQTYLCIIEDQFAGVCCSQ